MNAAQVLTQGYVQATVRGTCVRTASINRKAELHVSSTGDDEIAGCQLGT